MSLYPVLEPLLRALDLAAGMEVLGIEGRLCSWGRWVVLGWWEARCVELVVVMGFRWFDE